MVIKDHTFYNIGAGLKEIDIMQVHVYACMYIDTILIDGGSFKLEIKDDLFCLFCRVITHFQSSTDLGCVVVLLLFLMCFPRFMFMTRICYFFSIDL